MRPIAGLLTATLLFLGLLTTLAPRAYAVAMWSRKYGIACSDCHAFPSLTLTAMGLEFFRRGHRTEGEGGEKNFANLLSSHGEWNYSVQQHAPSPFPDPELHLHAGGPISPDFSAYADANLNADFEVLFAQFTKADGPSAYFTARAGRTLPSIIREYGNGLMSSASTPLVITDATLGPNPFTLGRASSGIDVAQRWKALFIQTGVVNGADVPGQVAVGAHKDAFVSAQVSLSDQPTGIGVAYFNGGYDVVADSAGSVVYDRYDRAAAFANFTQPGFRLAGAYARGREQIGSTGTQPMISGFYVQADVHPQAWITPFARYDWVRTERVVDAGTVKKETLGASTAIYVTDTTGGRLTLEVSRLDEAGSAANGGAISLLWAF